MRTLRRFFTRMVNSAAGREDERRMQEEIAEHIALQTEANVRAGLSPAEARRQAILKFGAVEAVKEEYRAERGLVFFETLVQDVRFAARLLRKSPSFSVVAVVTLAMGIGANAVVFSVLNALLLRPLGIPHEDRVYLLERSAHNPTQSYPDYLDLRDRNRTFVGLVAASGAQAGLDTGNNPAPVWLLETSGNYFEGLKPYLGRYFNAADERGPNSAPYLVLSHAYWHTHFQADRKVIGRTVLLNKHPFTIVGVAQPGFHGGMVFFYPDVFVPIVNENQIEGAIVQGTQRTNLLNARGTRWCAVGGLLKPGVTPAQAIADLNAIGDWLQKTYPATDGKTNFVLGRPGLYGDLAGPPVRAFMTVLMLLAGLILLAACANLGSLFAAHAADRSREVALRLALGSSRSRLLRQLFTEAILVSLLGGALGLATCVPLLRFLSGWQPFSRYPVHLAVEPDPNVFLVAALLTVASGFLFGAVPVRQVLNTNSYEVIKSGSMGRVGRRLTVRDVMLAVQVAICAVLITSSFVAVRGLGRSLRTNVGFHGENVMLADTNLSMAGYRGEQVPAMQKRMIEAAATIPAVLAVGMIDRPILDGTWQASAIFTDRTTDVRPANAVATPFWYSISPDYFRAAGTALLAGRTFTWHDDKGSPRVAVVNQELASQLFGSVSEAIGRSFKLEDGARVQVVGVVETGKYGLLTEDPKPAMFFPLRQAASNETSLVVLARDPRQAAVALRGKLRELDAGLPSSIQGWRASMDIAYFGARMATVSLGALGVMGSVLSITGIFGLAAYSVSKRLRELGIRMGLGAQRWEVLRAALGRAVKVLALGSGVGLVLGLLASRVLSALVSQATPRDPVVLAGVVFAMALLGLAATWIPAQRALSLDPSILLRED